MTGFLSFTKNVRTGGASGRARRNTGSTSHDISWDIAENKPTKCGPSSWIDSFRRAEPRRMEGDDSPYNKPSLTTVPPSHRSHYYDLGAANIRTANTALVRELKGRHLQMIAFGGAIGTGLFVASGNSLSVGGPGSLFFSFVVHSIFQYSTMQALGELCVLFPVSGSFSAFSTRFLDPSWGFAMGWNYCLQWIFVLPMEIIAGSYTISYWDDSLHKAAFVAVFLTLVIVINLFGVEAYGEAEFILSIIKVVAVIGFILLGVVINIGGHPDGGYIGWRYWSNPGAFSGGVKGFCTVLVNSSAAFAGTELIGIAAAETANPRKSLPSAIKHVFWRVSIFYCVSLLLIGLLVPYTDPRLLGSKSNAHALASPFVIAIETAGINILPSVMNAVILLAVVSVANSSVYGSSRMLLALAEQSHAPSVFTYIDRQGRPLVAILVSCLVGLLAFLADVEQNGIILGWLLSISGLCMLCTWGSICLCHIRFRKAWASASNTLDQLPYRSFLGVAGSWFALVGFFIVLIAQIWIAISPLNAGDTTDARVQGFFLRILALPFILAFYFLHKLWFRTRIVRTANMDITTGRRYFRAHLLIEQEREDRLTWSLGKKIYNFLC